LQARCGAAKVSSRVATSRIVCKFQNFDYQGLEDGAPSPTLLPPSSRKKETTNPKLQIGTGGTSVWMRSLAVDRGLGCCLLQTFLSAGSAGINDNPAVCCQILDSKMPAAEWVGAM
jgi:hypothetical protein